MKLFELATQTAAQCELGDLDITAAAGLDDAQAGEVTFLSNPKYMNRVATVRARRRSMSPRQILVKSRNRRMRSVIDESLTGFEARGARAVTLEIDPVNMM
jgi:UDP-3-O-[3-hydroxymyristoyl] glucosamine N-acyltransferase